MMASPTGGRFENFQEPECRLVVVGRTGSGKSSVVNILLDEKLSPTKMSFESVTTKVKLYSRRRFQKEIRVVDTPGLFDSRPNMTNEKVKMMLATTGLLLAPGPHAFLLTIRLDQRLTEDEKAVFSHLVDIFGNDYLNYTIVVFTHGDELRKRKINIEDFVKHAPTELPNLLTKVSHRYVVFDNTKKGNSAKILFDMVEGMVRRDQALYYINQFFFDAETVISEADEEVEHNYRPETLREKAREAMTGSELVHVINNIKRSVSAESLSEEINHEVKEAGKKKDDRELVSLLFRMIRALSRREVNDGKRQSAIQSMMVSSYMVTLVPLLE
ncbi:hypothetical protein C0Q70_19910 [Pomacea canaliculata]|uniref:AIG1-type G domain-containing protein n=2 Tax=Pomacea canaliculata TaxID=400727 RepID=A0A2T7NE24_POMCA|nr:hypothetical protein C0Q70_19910 [Pomacea canaliculata]